MKKNEMFSPMALVVYRILRVGVFLVFLGGISWVLIKTIFPNGGGYFNFRSYGSTKNTLADPRYENGDLVKEGVLEKDAPMLFNVSAWGDFPRVIVKFHGEVKESETLGKISLLRSYRAFLFPLGDPVVCPREGTLILTGENMRGVVSQGKIRFFVSEGDVLRRGFQLEQFLFIDSETAQKCPQGENIKGEETVVSGMLAKNNEGLFQFFDGEWVSFVSDRAFRSRYREEDATVFYPEVFSAYPVSFEKRIGFLDGSVVSYGESAYVVEGEALRPIDSPDTFLSKGYKWEDVVQMTGEEFGMYKRGKLYTRHQPHPDGTVFFEESSGKMFMVEKAKKRELIGKDIRNQFSSIRAIPASVTDLGTCSVVPRWFSFGCEIVWNDALLGIGSEYQFIFTPSVSLRITDARVTFIREKNRRNWELFVSDTLGKLRSRYPFLGSQ